MVDLDDLIGYIAVVQSTTQKSADSIGNSFKTMFARIQQVKLGSLLDSEGEDISNVETALKQYGITLREVDGTFKDTSGVLDELSGKWNTFNSAQKSEIATTVAGVRQRENFLSNRALIWKHIIETLLTAGKSLELYKLQRRYEIKSNVNVKNYKDWIISNEAPNRRTFNDYLEREYI